MSEGKNFKRKHKYKLSVKELLEMTNCKLGNITKCKSQYVRPVLDSYVNSNRETVNIKKLRKDVRNYMDKNSPKKFTNEEVFDRIINKQLEKYNVTVNEVLANPVIKDEDWFVHYSFDSHEEYEAWKEFAVNELMTNWTPKLPKKMATMQFELISLNYGLRQNY